MDFTKNACPDVMSLTPWAKKFADMFEADLRVKQHLDSRPQTIVSAQLSFGPISLKNPNVFFIILKIQPVK